MKQYFPGTNEQATTISTPGGGRLTIVSRGMSQKVEKRNRRDGNGSAAKIAGRRNATIHRKHLFGGQFSAEEVHSQGLAAAGARCDLCGAPPLTTFRSQALLVDLQAHSPQWVAAIATSNPNGSYVPTFESKYGPMVTISTAHACKGCTPAAAKMAAKHPSWIHVEIDYGPGPDGAVVGAS